MRDRPLHPPEVEELDEFRKAGFRLVGCAEDVADTNTILGKVTDFVYRIQTGNNDSLSALTDSDDKLIDAAWGVGSLLGNEFVRRLGWQWCLITDGEAEKFGVVSPDRGLILYPSFFVRDCLLDRRRDFTGHLIFNMVAAGRFKDMLANTYLDLSENVVRIVPR